MKTGYKLNTATTPAKQAKLNKAVDKLPEGWEYQVSEDGKQVLVIDAEGNTVACASRGKHIQGWCDCELILLNRACAALFGQQLRFDPSSK